jgi:hypothetical protein
MLITPSALTTSFYCSFLISHFFFLLAGGSSPSAGPRWSLSLSGWRAAFPARVDATACNGRLKVRAFQ